MTVRERAGPRGATGVRVLEIGTRLSGALAGLILAGQGADVCQVDEGLDRALDGMETAYFDRGRRTVPLGEDLLALARAADLLLTDLPPGEMDRLRLPRTTEALAALRPGLALAAVTSLGLEGPHAAFAMDDITEWAAGGLAYVTRRAVPDDDDEGYTPVLAPGRQPEMLAGIAAATAAFAALRLARLTGEAVVADVSRQEVQTAMLHGVVPPFVWNGTKLGAPHARLSGIGMLLPAADGEIYIRTVEPHQWTALIEWMGSPEWATEPWAADPMQRRAHWDAVKALVGAWTAHHGRAWLHAEGQRRHVPVALPATPADVLASEQFAMRGVWQSIGVDGGVAHAPSVPLVGERELAPSMRETTTDVLARWAR